MNNPRAFHQIVCVNKTNKLGPVLNIVHYRLQQSRCNYVSERKAAGAIPKGRTSLRFHKRHIFPRDLEETRPMDFLRPDCMFGFVHPSAFLIMAFTWKAKSSFRSEQDLKQVLKKCLVPRPTQCGTDAGKENHRMVKFGDLQCAIFSG